MVGSGWSPAHTLLWRTTTTRLCPVSGQWRSKASRVSAGAGVAVGGGGLVGVAGTGV
jgi:hypothetical protein